jgi:hypothetical protein
MNQLDVYYRAWLNYRAITAKNRDCALFRRNVAHTDTELESLSIIRNVCNVEEDWICEIEKGLIYIEKAIKEERQFIYSNGEVVPIEKVKNFSREAVYHLAKHSELITREQDGDNIVPDKLYNVERLNDYTVYENRFLYMLLCYLRDFVTVRYDKILELSNKYDGSLTLNKCVVSPSQKITYSIQLHEESRNDKYLREHNQAKDVIDRIDLILKSILALLATPLMEAQAKVAMLKPPITKTNVLKMDNNFKAAVALYEYVIAYEKPGYTVDPKNRDIAPFGETLGDEIAEMCAMLSFLTYKHGLDIERYLKNNYELDESRRKDQELAQRAEQLAALKRRLEKSEISPEEYILSLEKHIKLMDGQICGIENLRKEVAELKDSIETLNLVIQDKDDQIVRLGEEAVALQAKHFEEIERLKSEHREQINDMIAVHEQEINELVAKNNDRIKALGDQMNAQRAKASEEIAELREQLKAKGEEHTALTAENRRLEEEKTLCEAKIKALRIEHGLIGADEEYTEKESFDELEKEFEAFTRFYNSQWGATKKKIRKKLLNFENLKGHNEQK